MDLAGVQAPADDLRRLTDGDDGDDLHRLRQQRTADDGGGLGLVGSHAHPLRDTDLPTRARVPGCTDALQPSSRHTDAHYRCLRYGNVLRRPRPGRLAGMHTMKLELLSQTEIAEGGALLT